TAAAFRGDACFRTWMHQLLNGTGDKSVVDEEILVHVQFGVATFQIPGAIIRYAMAQNQILRPSRRANRVGLHKAEFLERGLQTDGSKQALPHRRAAQIVKSHLSSSSNEKRPPALSIFRISFVAVLKKAIEGRGRIASNY